MKKLLLTSSIILSCLAYSSINAASNIANNQLGESQKQLLKLNEDNYNKTFTIDGENTRLTVLNDYTILYVDYTTFENASDIAKEDIPNIDTYENNIEIKGKLSSGKILEVSDYLANQQYIFFIENKDSNPSTGDWEGEPQTLTLTYQKP